MCEEFVGKGGGAGARQPHSIEHIEHCLSIRTLRRSGKLLGQPGDAQSLFDRHPVEVEILREFSPAERISLGWSGRIGG